MPRLAKPPLANLQQLVDELPLRAVRLLARVTDLEERVAIRLDRWIRSMGKDWQPDQQFMNAMSQLCYTSSKTVAEIRQLEKARDASKLSDADLQEGLREVAREELRKMPDSEFLALIDERNGVSADGDGDVAN